MPAGRDVGRLASIARSTTSMPPSAYAIATLFLSSSCAELSEGSEGSAYSAPPASPSTLSFRPAVPFRA